MFWYIPIQHEAHTKKLFKFSSKNFKEDVYKIL